MTLVTSNHTYELLSFYDLTEKQQEKSRKEFDWFDELDSSYGFFVYKKELYHVGSFMRHNDFLTDEKTGKKFYAHGIYNWSAFNGLALEFVHNDSAIKVAYYY